MAQHTKHAQMAHQEPDTRPHQATEFQVSAASHQAQAAQQPPTPQAQEAQQPQRPRPGQDPPALLAGYLVDHELAIPINKATYDDLVGPNAFSKTAGGS